LPFASAGWRILKDLDKTDPSQLDIPTLELTRGNLQGKLSRLLTAAGDKERAVAIKVHQLLTSLE
jgi:hypothetical protein